MYDVLFTQPKLYVVSSVGEVHYILFYSKKTFNYMKHVYLIYALTLIFDKK